MLTITDPMVSTLSSTGINQLPGDLKLSNMVYYRDDHTDSVKCSKETVDAFGATFTNVNTWQQLVKEIEQGEDKIVFHIDTIDKYKGTIEEFINSVRSVVKFIPGHRPLKILVVITPTTTQQQVQQLEAASCLGIGLDLNHYTVEQAVAGAKALINGVPYWPRHIISQLPDTEQPPISIYFRADSDTYVTADMVQNLKKNAICRPRFCSDWNELGDALKKRPHQLVFYIGMLTRLDLSVTEIIESLRTRMQLSFVNVPIGVGIEPTTPMSVIKELKRAGIFGIVPSAVHWGTEATVAGLNALARREPYWPKHILDQLPGNKPVVEKNTNSGVKLTVRQQEVMELICRRGLSNKQIAKSLNLSESTVKIHVSAVMKVHGVQNRTQLALSAGTGLRA